ncbi:unnamed protein product, partial [Ectocarpus sp. 12 AP-2014]
MSVDIAELLRLEAELENSCEDCQNPYGRDAKLNLLKFLQIKAVLQFEEAYDQLYYELNKHGGLECLREIAPARLKDLLQPKILELQDCNEDVRFAAQLEFYLAGAELAKNRLDDLVAGIAEHTGECEVHCAEVKSRASTQRKARKSYGGDVRKVADMARVSVICDNPEALKRAYSAIVESFQGDVLRVANGFNSDWMPSGYRDVKVNPVVDEHLCEIQLHLREFFTLKSGQHAVYEWARDLKVTTIMRAENLFEFLSREITEEMIGLAQRNWHGTGRFLPRLQLAAGQYDQAEKGFRQKLSEADNNKRGEEDNGSTESREASPDV